LRSAARAAKKIFMPLDEKKDKKSPSSATQEKGHLRRMIQQSDLFPECGWKCSARKNGGWKCANARGAARACVIGFG